ncbi:MAG: histidine phosphatase family protein [Bacteroidetes bacterium]|nr:histidine phosphatase family protein [Bacteroidota bacterium]
MTKFLLIRHALTDSVGVRLSGRIPGLSLNKEGKKQSIELTQRLAHFNLDAIYCSPLERAVETAFPIAKWHKLEIFTSDDFIEIDFGIWTNLTIEELRNDPVFVSFNSFRSKTRIPGGELMDEAQRRIVNGLKKLNIRYPNKTVAIISHADLIKSAIAYFAGIHLDFMVRIEISPASVSIIEIYDETARIHLVNGTG